MFFLILRTPVISSFVDPKIFRDIFLSNITCLFSSDFLSIQVSEPYRITSRIKVIYNRFFFV